VEWTSPNTEKSFVKRRWRLLLGLVLLLVVSGLLLVPQVRWPLYGWLRGEPFCDGMPASWWALALEDPTAYADAVSALKKAGPPAVPVLVRAIRQTPWRVPAFEDNPDNRRYGALLLALEEVAEPSLVPALVDHLRDGGVTCWALQRLGTSAVPALIEALDDPDANLRQGAARTLGLIGPEARTAVAALIHALRDDQLFVRCNAADALGRIGAEPESVIPALMAAHDDPDRYMGASAVRALGRFGPRAESAVPLLIKALGDHRMEYEATQALKQIGPDAQAAAPHLLRMVQDPKGDELHRAFVAEALVAVDPANRDVVPILRQLVESKSVPAREVAARVLQAIEQPNAGIK
jgi:HEAT repeat protein